MMKHIRGIIEQSPLSIKKSQKAIEEVLNHPYVVKFILESGEVDHSQLKRALPKLKQYISEIDCCKQCTGLDTCPNLMKGHSSKLYHYHGNIDLMLSKCEVLENTELERKREKLIQSHNIPKEIKSASLDDIHWGKGRADAIEKAVDFTTQIVLHGNVSKGIYFYGGFGVGKTYITGSIVNKLANHHIASIMVHVPSLINEMRDAIGESIRQNRASATVTQKVDALSRIPVLVLDDIGMESYTPWIRDNVLGVILQNRMVEKLPTIYTSNLSINELEEAMSLMREKGNTYTDLAGAKRVMERIRPYVVPVSVEGKNWRYE
ncbi:primosomal protein DnaI [Croceifilum oryzae]|uniref:Primosomal protein DnaI n=1 Tax=Croceifilum oryzae TaxID=1553429 RepID=A0AAJ1WU15_9BACL|nr:primosomal protein DnaI [Croceifilum oryzae]MDQ0418588.1 primosomal protein DnaI [Croceifilum oryzae]